MPVISTNEEHEIMQLVAQGNKIAAIKRYRELTGVGLADAKEAIERMEPAVPAVRLLSQSGNELDTYLENRIKGLLADRKKIEAVKAYRAAFGCGLKEAKDAVDVIETAMRRDGLLKRTLSKPLSDTDPFAEEVLSYRMRLILYVVMFLVGFGAFAYFFLAP